MTESDRIFVATRKGLFTIGRAAGNAPRWTIGAPQFLGDPVTDVLHDARDGALYATLNLGHFGVKLRRSDDGGASWQEIAVPAYPPQPESLSKEPDPVTGRPPAPWKLQQLWRLETGGADEPEEGTPAKHASGSECRRRGAHVSFSCASERMAGGSSSSDAPWLSCNACT